MGEAGRGTYGEWSVERSDEAGFEAVGVLGREWIGECSGCGRQGLLVSWVDGRRYCIECVGGG